MDQAEIDNMAGAVDEKITADRDKAEARLRRLVSEIRLARDDFYETEKTPKKQTLPRMSGIRRCAREMTHQIISWDKRPRWDQWQVERFQRGRDIEKLSMVPELMRMGFDVVRGQLSLELKSRDGKKTIATGHIDGEIEHVRTEGSVSAVVRTVFDAKSMHPILWNRIPADPDGWAMEGMRYMMEDKYAYSYPWQILMYMWTQGRETGLFIIDDLGGHWKFIPVIIWDWIDEIELVLDRLESVSSAIESGSMPDYYDDPSYCRDCWAFQAGVCQPPMSFKDSGLTVIQNERVTEVLDRLHEIRTVGQEYNRLDKAMKDTMKGAGLGRFLVGNHLVEVSEYQTSRVKVPDEMRKAYTIKSMAKRVKVSQIGEPDK